MTDLLFDADPRVGFAGDWHGNHNWAKNVLNHFAEENITIIYHAGDFGLWPGGDGKYYLTVVHKTLEANNQHMYVVLGNHEDYDRVAVMQTDENGWMFLKNYPRMRFAPRGHVWLHAGTRMAAMGGAASVDLRLRTVGKSWWPQEEITDEDCQTLVKNVLDEGWKHVDVMVTHDAPAGLHRPGMLPKPSWFTPEIEHYAWTQRVRLREALDTVAPRWLVHAHWHEWYRDAWDGVTPEYDTYECQVVGLTCDGMAKNAIIAELAPGFGLMDMQVLMGNVWVTWKGK